MEEPKYRIRALHTPDTVTVYQAYRPEIGLPAARDGRFPATWKRDRMTWIKPSFLWMMYRCGWGAKEGQETVLAVEITREGFEWALRNACLSHYVRRFHPDEATWKRQLRQAPARVQWDPERDLHLRPLPYRSLQLGLSGEASRRYADEWTVSVTDVTPLAHDVHALVRAGDPTAAARLLPREEPYPTPDGLLDHLLVHEAADSAEPATETEKLKSPVPNIP
ncbi:hypothetical protein AQF52_4737 [Streptomyces venezuelae]|uniref:DUF4291 domain-containing protein n=1 Tax=Streptomyces gardneri TaxID=66892 RepID=UPI0006E15121|nr:DUF4291 domain-containing protein [Streptomyces gardneri]ALO10331.1 hypothetical protein AQF52_4737 [Streptomyces venezuelae]QPK47345.1 DUF4291 domain-containing protein [Streptomyces gardneri]WRK38772.1 DUF4291 domain-containing protein [Streptomyces venezuelae]